MKLPAETDPWVQEKFRKPDGSFNAAAYNRWLLEEEQRLAGPLKITDHDKWMAVWLQRIIEEANMFYNGMVPLLPSYYKTWDEVPWAVSYTHLTLPTKA